MINEQREKEVERDSLMIKMKILQSAIILYPWLEENEYCFDGLIALDVESSQMINSVCKLVNPWLSMRVVPLSASPKEIKKAIDDSSYGIVAFRQAEGRYVRENLEILESVVLQSATRLEESHCILIFVCGV